MIGLAIEKLRPGAEFILVGGYPDYEIVWIDETQSCPTNNEINEVLPEIELQENAKEVRNGRDQLLTETDWVVVKHNELGTPIPQEWLDYRQALRDIPLQTGFPEEIEWPQEPES